MRRHRTGAVAVALLTALAGRALGQTQRELVDGARDTHDVVDYGMGYGQQRFSPLAQIDKGSVKRLVPVWNFSFGGDEGSESQPLVYHGIVYVTAWNQTLAIDAKTGRQLWRKVLPTISDVRSYSCCGLVNRGAALYDGKLFRQTMDDVIVAYDVKTGTQTWRQAVADFRQGYTMTGAPLVADGVLITGVSCGEFGGRGFLDGWDPADGKHLWRRYTVPAPGEPGSETWPDGSWKRGGGATWLTGSFDPELHTVYWGTGNPAPYNPATRDGDNLYTDSVLALDPKTGAIRWHYQFTPDEIFDHDGNNELVQATLEIAGKPTPVIMQADKNGFFYVLDRVRGKLLAANPFVRQTWSKGVDLKTGRPVESETTLALRRGETVDSWPDEAGGKNWAPMSYNPKTGLVYANTLTAGGTFTPFKPEYRLPAKYLGMKEKAIRQGPSGYLKAIEPLTGKARWEVPSELPRWSGTLTTAGGLVFTGEMSGEFEAFDADDGRKLWQFQTGSGIVSQPVTWEQDGVQYVAVTSGLGGSYATNSHDPRLDAIPRGSSLWVFALFNK